MRDVLEETGYISEDWQYLGTTVESSAKLTNYMHIYFANHCHKVSGQHLDATEELEVLLVPLRQAVDMVMNNEICCNSSVHGEDDMIYRLLILEDYFPEMKLERNSRTGDVVINLQNKKINEFLYQWGAIRGYWT